LAKGINPLYFAGIWARKELWTIIGAKLFPQGFQHALLRNLTHTCRAHTPLFQPFPLKLARQHPGFGLGLFPGFPLNPLGTTRVFGAPIFTQLFALGFPPNPNFIGGRRVPTEQTVAALWFPFGDTPTGGPSLPQTEHNIFPGKLPIGAHVFQRATFPPWGVGTGVPGATIWGEKHSFARPQSCPSGSQPQHPQKGVPFWEKPGGHLQIFPPGSPTRQSAQPPHAGVCSQLTPQHHARQTP